MSAPPRRHCGAQNTTGSCSLQSVPNTGNVCTALDTGHWSSGNQSVSALPWHSLATLWHWHTALPGPCLLQSQSIPRPMLLEWTLDLDCQWQPAASRTGFSCDTRTGWDRQVVLAGYWTDVLLWRLTAISSSCCVVLTLDMLHLFLFYELFMMILLIMVKSDAAATNLKPNNPFILIKTRYFGCNYWYSLPVWRCWELFVIYRQFPVVISLHWLNALTSYRVSSTDYFNMSWLKHNEPLKGLNSIQWW